MRIPPFFTRAEDYTTLGFAIVPAGYESPDFTLAIVPVAKNTVDVVLAAASAIWTLTVRN